MVFFFHHQYFSVNRYEQLQCDGRSTISIDGYLAHLLVEVDLDYTLKARIHYSHDMKKMEYPWNILLELSSRGMAISFVSFVG